MQTLEEGGWVKPAPASSEHMRVTFGGFLIDLARRSMSLQVGVAVQSVPEGGRFLQVTFPQSDPVLPSERVTLTLDGSEEYETRSGPLSGLKNFESYPVVVQLTVDEAGTTVLDELTQYVRFEAPPIDALRR